MVTDHDVIVIGAGCAGLAAGLYTARSGFDTIVMEKKNLGGELASRQLIENYPGFPDGVQGPELATFMTKQAENYGVEFVTDEAASIKSKESYKMVRTVSGDTITCKGIVLATGSHPRLLGVPGEKELTGKGVFYCATCDGPRCAGKYVMVAGAGDSGLTEALNLVKLGCKVTVVEFMEKPKASQIMQDRCAENDNIEIICNWKTNSISGTDWVTGVEIENRATGEKRTLNVEGVFIRVGQLSNTDFVKGLVNMAPNGQVIVDQNMQSSVPGIVAAGDIRSWSPAQISTGVGDGVTAAMTLVRYLNTRG
jgi:thioredoxin reductase (NADPH)